MADTLGLTRVAAEMVLTPDRVGLGGGGWRRRARTSGGSASGTARWAPAHAS